MAGATDHADDASHPRTRTAARTAMRPPVTVVICAYTERRLRVLQSAVVAVREQLLPGDELLVVIDHNERLLEQARTLLAVIGNAVDVPAAPLRVIASDNSPGLSGARNAGIAAARGALIAFLDDDAVPRRGWLAELTEPFADEHVIGTGGVAAPAWEQERPDWLPDEFLWVVGCSYRGLPELPAEIRNPIGANMAFRRSTIRQAGGFTDGIGRVGRVPLGCEETEFAIRAARITGGRILQQPAAAVDHLVTSERVSLRYFLHRCWAEGISKAFVSRLAGGDAALASERRYTTRTLPAGVAAGIKAGLRGDSDGFRRATAIVAGLAVTVAGYLRGSAGQRHRRVAASPTPANPPAFTPLWSGQLELTAPALPPRLSDSEGRPLERARILVRAAGTPLGFLELDSPGGRLELDATIGLARDRFGVAVTDAISDARWAHTTSAPVSVVLCTHNRSDGATRTLESLLELRYPSLEIIVVDNAPADASTRAVVERVAQRDPRVRYVREDRKGLSCARNRGLREAGGRFVAFTDDDVRVDPLWVNGLMRGFSRAPRIACVTGLVASAALERRAEQYFDQRVWWSSSCEPRVVTARRGAGDSPLHPYTAGTFGTGANFAADVSVLRSLGGFDECLGAGSPTQGGEDLDIFVRLLTAGRALGYEPSALVWHEHRVDDESLRRQMYAYGLGLTAYLTKYLLARGSRRELVRRVPGAAGHALALLRRSREAAGRASLDQAGIGGIELRGMLAGPLAYLRARWRADPGHVRAVAP
jgi:glycosyltransferase involved in cell wall biosynthesis